MEVLSDNIIEDLNLRLEKYSTVLRSAEEENNPSKVRRYTRIIKQYENSIKDAKAGKPVALGDLPNPPGFPPLVASPNDVNLNVDSDHISPKPSLTPSPMPSPPMTRKQELEQPIIEVEEAEELPADPLDIVDKLTIRLEKYQLVLKSAEVEGVAAKVRRYKRIINQYNEAIKGSKAGKEVDLSELPNPPGLPPLVAVSTPQPSPQPSPTPMRRQPSPSRESNTLAPSRPAPSPPTRFLSRADKQTATLKERQKEYRDAAITAKKAGQISEAKEFLKISKGFDRLILASESGLPVDLSTIPVSLQAAAQTEESFHMVSEKDFSESSERDVFEMLKNELQEQIKSCMARRAHLKNSGDVANANRFEQWALTFKKDLNKVVMYQSSGHPIPKFHYEQKSFPVVHCFSDVAAGELELSIVQAVSLAKPLDTYVGYEFPFPAEAGPSGYTPVIKNSVNPVYNFTVTFPIDRDAKPCQRIFKRHGIKLEVWIRSGFLRKDISQGTVVVKLLPLTTDIMIHDAFDIMNGRRPTGAKLEVKIRVREPILAKRIDTITEKWLILD